MELNLRVDLSLRLAGMLSTVKDENLSIDAHSRKDVGILGLVSGLVDLAGVIDLLRNVELDLGDLAGLAVATNLTPVLVEILGVGLGGLWDFYLGDLDVVGLVV